VLVFDSGSQSSSSIFPSLSFRAAMIHENDVIKHLTSQSMDCHVDKRADFIATALLVMIAGENVGKDDDVNTVHDDEDEELQTDVVRDDYSSEMDMSRLPTWSSTAVMTASPPQFNGVGQLPTPIDMIRSVSGATPSDDDDDGGETDGDDTMETETDDDRSSSSSSTVSSKVKGVSFNESVRVLPIPPLSHYTLEQRRNMYANRFEVRENKLRNKKEYAFDNYDWKNCTEESSMVICPMSGNLLHPAHF
jgi:hypothetical protein